jgi:peptide/nickel transport system ATP-binding protein
VTPIAELRSASKRFALPRPWPWSERVSVDAVADVSLTLVPGDVLALVGQSGSGKTTVARMLLGLEQPTSGTVWLEGRRWDDLPESRRRPRRPRYQYVPQDALSALDPQQTAMEAVTETLSVLRGLGPREAADRAIAMLDRLGLGRRRDALPREMSGGEQRRVTLARVLALEPALVVADEPTSGLDADRQESVLADLVGNLPAGACCVLVTHDMPVVRRWCTRGMVMLEGRVVEVLPSGDAEPTHPYARLLFDPWGEHDLSRSAER